MRIYILSFNVSKHNFVPVSNCFSTHKWKDGFTLFAIVYKWNFLINLVLSFVFVWRFCVYNRGMAEVELYLMHIVQRFWFFEFFDSAQSVSGSILKSLRCFTDTLLPLQAFVCVSVWMCMTGADSMNGSLCLRSDTCRYGIDTIDSLCLWLMMGVDRRPWIVCWQSSKDCHYSQRFCKQETFRHTQHSFNHPTSQAFNTVPLVHDVSETRKRFIIFCQQQQSNPSSYSESWMLLRAH